MVTLAPPLTFHPLPRCGPKAPFVAARHPLPRWQTILKYPSNFSRFSRTVRRPNSPLISKAPGKITVVLFHAAGSVEYVVEPATNVKFPRELAVPGCSDLLVLLGTGYREKVFAIIGVKVYASGFYAETSLKERLSAWKGKSASEISGDSSLFNSIFEASLKKSINITLVRDVDGKTFWNALEDVISPRIRKPTAIDESALSTFRNTFQGCDLKQGTYIFLTWIEPSKMLISISSDGLPSNIDAEIESVNVTMALYDAFLGNYPVSPSLKKSVANALEVILN